MRYDALAPIYDRLMSHVEYEEWVELVRRMLRRCGAPENPCILEIGAGTGVVGSILKQMGYRYIASDLSPSMCKEASRRRGLPVCAAAAPPLAFRQSFDAALFLYDGINYMMTAADYRALFASVCVALRAGGLFLFDITTHENSRRHFTRYLDFEDYGDFSYARYSYFDENASIQHNDFTIYKQSETYPSYYEKFVESHEQKVFSVPEIEKTIPKKSFDVLGIWDGFSFRKYTSRSIRVHFLLQKKEER
jgi:SAM-dependent methyltransferase